jgi:AcrR family transcriptional regulator
VEAPVNPDPRAPVEIEARLLPVVEDLLFKKGYAGLNIREIAKEIGMGPATIYRYFLSKENLALRVVQDQDRETAKAITPLIQIVGSDYGKWKSFYQALLSYYDAHPVIAVVQNISMPTNTWFLPEDKWPVTDVARIIRKLIRDGRASQGLDSAVADNQIMATHYMYLVREVRLWRSRDMKWRLADRIDRFFPIVWKTISNPESFAQSLAETRASA